MKRSCHWPALVMHLGGCSYVAVKGRHPLQFFSVAWAAGLHVFVRVAGAYAVLLGTSAAGHRCPLQLGLVVRDPLGLCAGAKRGRIRRESALFQARPVASAPAHSGCQSREKQWRRLAYFSGFTRQFGRWTLLERSASCGVASILAYVWRWVCNSHGR